MGETIRIHGGMKKDIRIDHSVNINPLGMPGACLEAAEEALRDVIKYPDIFNDELIRELSLRNAGNHIVLGNGSCELIYALCHYLGHRYPGYQAFTIAPTFTEYGYAISSSGGNVCVFKTCEENDFSLEGSVDGFIERIEGELSVHKPVKLVIICNPNNPTGELIRRASLEKMAGILAHHEVILMVDECFLGFSNRYEDITMTTVLDRYKNVIVVDAFTKLYAMPGLRLGYAVSSDKVLLDGIRRNIQPWNVSGMAVKAGLCALKDLDYLIRTVELIGEQRAYITCELKKLSLKVIGSPEAPFIMFEGPFGLRDRLNKLGIDIRDCSDMMAGFVFDRHYYRMAVGNEEDNMAVIAGLRAVMEGKII